MGLFRRRSEPPRVQPAGGPLDGPLGDLALFALTHAVRSVVPEGGPLIPFAMVETTDGRALARFVGDLEEAQARARDHVRASSAVRAAVAWDGYLTVEGVRTDALFVEAGEPGTAGIVLAHRYRDAGAGPAEAIGRPILVDPARPPLL